MMPRTIRRERGIALIIVLWAVVLLSAVGSSMIAAGRNDVALAGNLRASAIAMAAADGAIQQAAFHVLPCANRSGCTLWPTTGAPVDASRDGVAIAVCLIENAGRINPNEASPALLAALLAARDVAGPDAARLAGAIVAWRTPAPTPTAAAEQLDLYRQAGLPYAPDGQKFSDVDDLRFVLGMTPAILDRLRPDLSVWGRAEPDPALASEVARTALASLGAPSFAAAIPGSQSRAIGITATATIPRGAQFTRAAVVGLNPDPAKGSVRILSWTAAPQAPCAAARSPP